MVFSWGGLGGDLGNSVGFEGVCAGGGAGTAGDAHGHTILPSERLW